MESQKHPKNLRMKMSLWLFFKKIPEKQNESVVTNLMKSKKKRNPNHILDLESLLPSQKG